jgi:SAM-dependent methyltransferase
LALNPVALEKLLGKLKPGDAIASMGYPDIIFPPEGLAQLVGPRIEKLQYREDSDDICKRHGLKPHKVPNAESLFELYGATLDVFDITDERGCEIILDLNYPLPANAVGQFDYVLDVGTLEHCFNAPQAMVNMAAMLKVGGIIIHENPFNWGNHGFWNLNPTLYHDFYTDNGFEILELKILTRDGRVAEAPMTKRFQFLEAEANCFVIAAKVEDVETTFPKQSKYRG